MTQQQKDQIAELRRAGGRYAVIANSLGISENTVKSYCRRNRSTLPSSDADFCRQCGKPLTQTPYKRTKRFCSNTCRAKWWLANASDENRKAIYTLTCPTCGRQFTAYGNAHRKYCSRACYNTARRMAHE